MSRIFIGYRRDDSRGDARYLRRLLVERFGKARVYMDIDNIPPGVNFVDAVRTALGGAAAALIVIGRRWLSTENRARLHEPNDLVRQEIAQALSAKLLVVPVLVDGADMPGAKDLPQNIVALATRNAFHLREHSFESDVKTLIRTLENLPGMKDSGAAKSPRQQSKEPRAGGSKPARGTAGAATARKPETPAGDPRKAKERTESAPKPRRRQAAKQPQSDAPRSPGQEAGAKAKGAQPSKQTQPKARDGQRPGRPADSPSSGRKPAAKKAAPSGVSGAKSGGRKTAGQKGQGVATDGRTSRAPKPGGAAKSKTPASKTRRAKSGGTGARQG